MKIAVLIGAVALGHGAPAPAAAEEVALGDAAFRADTLEMDAQLRELTLRGGVVVAFGRYRLASDALRIARTPEGFDVLGEARLAFCPCPDPPAVLAFQGGTLERGGDVTLRWPRLEILGVPVFALPWIWIRPPDRIGLLPPSIEWRGEDGLRIGSGVHLPWIGPDGAPRLVQATAAGYVMGGVALGAHLEAPSSTASILWDWRDSSRLVLRARGADLPESPGDAAAAWDVDAIRGDRALARTPDLEAAARPFDAALADTSLRIDSRGGALSGILAVGAIARAERGVGRVAAGPRASIAAGGAIASFGAWDTEIGGAVLSDDTQIQGGAAPIALASLGGELTFHPGPFELRTHARGRARVAARGVDEPSEDATAVAHAGLGLPLARVFEAAPGEAPILHVIVPSVEAQAVLLHRRGDFFLAPYGDDAPGASWIAAAGASSSVGRAAGGSLRASLHAGAAGFPGTGAGAAPSLAMAHARVGLQFPWIAADLEAALVRQGLAGAPDLSADPAVQQTSFAILARARLGHEDGLSLHLDAAGQDGANARVARALAGEWSSAAVSTPAGEIPYLAEDGWSAAAEVAVPWTSWLGTRARASADLTAGRLLSIGGDARVLHHCGCLAVSAGAAYRVGREGIDAAVTLDLAPDLTPR